MMNLQKKWRLHQKRKNKNICDKEISEIPMNEEYEYDFMRNQNYHYLAVTKPTALFGKFLV